MKIYTHDEMKVLVIAGPALRHVAIHEYTEAHDSPWYQEDTNATDGDLLPEFAGRMCYRAFGPRQGRKSNTAYIANILSQGHGSVLEHACWSFLAMRVSRGLTHELVRHRAGWAYSQESTHFIDYSDARNWTLCLDPRLSSAAINRAEQAARVCYVAYGENYADAIADGHPKKVACSMARQSLPTGTESQIVFTANARALRHFVELRGAPDNVLEMRLLACRVAQHMLVEAPSMFQDVRVPTHEDGFPHVVSDHRKV